MTRAERQQRIGQWLDREGAGTYAALSRALGVCTMTIRRDIGALAKRGALVQIPRGARRAQAPAYLTETGLAGRLQEHRAEKRAIAAAALSLVATGQSLYLDGSTTCLELARLLGAHERGLTIVSNSALVCLEAGQGGKNRVIGLGGHYDPASLSFCGPETEAACRAYWVDGVFVSTLGYIPEEGTFESAEPVLRIKQLMAGQCRRLTLLVDHSKFGRRALRPVLRRDQIQTVVTDAAAPKPALRRLRQDGIQVVTAAVACRP